MKAIHLEMRGQTTDFSPLHFHGGGTNKLGSGDANKAFGEDDVKGFAHGFGDKEEW